MFRCGELLLVPVPHTDLRSVKRRPVLALTGPDQYGDFIGLPVTSRPHHPAAIAIMQADLLSGQLPAPSWIRTDRVASLNESLVEGSVAELAPSVLAQAIRQLCRFLETS